MGILLLRSVRRRKVIQGDLENQISSEKHSRIPYRIQLML